MWVVYLSEIKLSNATVRTVSVIDFVSERFVTRINVTDSFSGLWMWLNFDELSYQLLPLGFASLQVSADGFKFTFLIYSIHLLYNCDVFSIY